jgi:hypothetical protein
MAGVRDEHGQEIMLGEHEVTHTYEVILRFYLPGSSMVIDSRTRGPFALLTADESILDLDLLIPTETPGQATAVWVGDRFTEFIQIAQSQALAAAARADEASNSASVAEMNSTIATQAATQSQQSSATASSQAVQAGSDARAAAQHAAAAHADAAFARSIADRDWTGERGIPGPPGPVRATIGSVTTGPAGSLAQVVNSGTNQDLILNFTIPRGNPGQLTEVSTWADFSSMFQ